MRKRYLIAGLVILPMISMANPETLRDSLRYGRFKDKGLDLFNQGSYRQAYKPLRKAKNIARKHWGKTHSYHIDMISYRAMLDHELARYQRALQKYRKAKELILKSGKPKHRSKAILLNAKSCTFRAIGCYQKAKDLAKKARNLIEKVHANANPLMAVATNNIGNILERQGKLQAAKSYYQKALKLDTLANRQNDVQHADHLRDMGTYYLQQHRTSKARSYFQRSLQLFKREADTLHSYYTRLLYNFCQLYLANHNHSQFISTYERALGLNRSLGLEQRPQNLKTLNLVAAYYANRKKPSKAYNYYQKLHQIVEKQLFQSFSFLSQKEKSRYLDLIQRNFHQFQTFTARYHEEFSNLKGKVYNNRLLLNNLLLKQQKTLRPPLEARAHSEIDSLFRQWKAIRQVLARQKALPKPKRIPVLDSLKQQKNHLERQLSLDGKAGDLKSPQWQTVQKHLRKSEAALEFIKFPSPHTNNASYAALLITQDLNQPKWIPISSAAELQKLVLNTQPATLYRRAGKGLQLHQQLWKPIAEHLDGIKTIYYNPTGVLHRLSFQAIPLPEEPRLFQAYNLVRLTSTEKITNPDQAPTFDDAALLGGIRYEYDTTDERRQSQHPQLVMRNDNSQTNYRTKGATFDFLEGSLDEVQSIKPVLSRKRIKTKLMQGDRASESAFKSLSGNSPDIIHLATHGFYLPCDSTKKPLTNKSGSAAIFSAASDPMLRSGLAMAGSNYAWQHGYNPYEAENGLLTAYEIANLDLRKTDLAVLSACKSGLGAVKGSQGVYGLQRAFRLAGVDYLIMSLWKIPDKPTKKLIKLFYKYWNPGSSIRQAFRKAKQTMAKQHPPAQWAGLVLIGGGQLENASAEGTLKAMTGIHWGGLLGLLLASIFGYWAFRKT